MASPLDYLAEHKAHHLYPRAVDAVEMTEQRYGAEAARRKAVEIAAAMTDSKLLRKMREQTR